MMPKNEGVKTTDEVSCVLYDKDGKVKDTRKHKKTFKEKLIAFIKKVAKHW